MDETDGRVFNHYDAKKRLPMQVTLLRKLEELGYETKNKYILTNKRLGVPITIMLLLMKEAVEHILEEQCKVEEVSRLISIKTTDELKKEFNVELISNDENNIKNASWEYKRCLYSNNEDIISGSSICSETNVFIPQESFNFPLEQVVKSSNSKIKIHKNVIQEIIEEPNSYSMIKLFKDIVLYLEFSYAVKERIKTEIESIKKLVSIEIDLPTNYKSFEKNCQRRGALIHGGILNVSINPSTARLCISKSDLVNSFEEGLNEACSWVNEVYSIMMSMLGNKKNSVLFQ